MSNTIDFNQFLNSYLECALWSSTDDEGNPLDSTHDIDNFSIHAIATAKNDCNDFIENNKDLLETVGTSDQHGHDFWLTRNGHGAGFWDRGYGEVGDKLTQACKPYGDITLYINDNDKVDCA